MEWYDWRSYAQGSSKGNIIRTVDTFQTIANIKFIAVSKVITWRHITKIKVLVFLSNTY